MMTFSRSLYTQVDLRQAAIELAEKYGYAEKSDTAALGDRLILFGPSGTVPVTLHYEDSAIWCMGRSAEWRLILPPFQSEWSKLASQEYVDTFGMLFFDDQVRRMSSILDGNKLPMDTRQLPADASILERSLVDDRVLHLAVHCPEQQSVIHACFELLPAAQVLLASLPKMLQFQKGEGPLWERFDAHFLRISDEQLPISDASMLVPSGLRTRLDPAALRMRGPDTVAVGF